MQLQQLTLRNFRNYVNESIIFSPGINLIYGRNGAGKTNLLEAIYLLSVGRSFRTSHLTDLIRKESSYFYIEANFKKDGLEQSLSIGFDGKNKKICYNRTTLSNFSHLLGLFPSVLYAPIDSQLITGAPLERRRFLNIQLAQSNPFYVHHLMRYHKSMKHRNTLLKAKNEVSLDSWEGIMASSARYLIVKRAALVEELNCKVQEFSEKISNSSDQFDLFYSPSIGIKHLDNIQNTFQTQRRKEFILGTTLSGPHRDDFLVCFQNRAAKTYASEGQKKTCIAALKLAERERLSMVALLGIDDFGIHLDGNRTALLYKSIASIGQVFLTVPSDKLIKQISYSRCHYVKSGMITSDSPTY